MAKKEIIENLIKQEAASRGWYVLESKVVPSKGVVQVRLVIDSENGVGIDECAQLSRELYPLIENTQIYTDFELMVSSPGVGEPLLLPFQIRKNIGRKVKVTTEDGQTIEGKLTQYNEQSSIEIELQLPKASKGLKENRVIEISKVKKIIVLVSFN